MPRELVHWSVLERAMEILRTQGETALVARLEETKPAVMIGAVVHDAPYYHRLGKSDFTRVAEYLHGTDGEDTFEPMRVFLKLARNQGHSKFGQPLLAVLAGLLSHIATDSVFHPMVYYFSGNYYDPLPENQEKAQQRHRLLEVYLDSWIEKAKPPQETLIRSYWRSTGREQPLIAAALDRMSRELRLPSTVKYWKESIRTHAKAQHLFRSSTAGLFFRAATTFLPRLRNEDALFRFGRTNAPAWLQAEIQYRNPITGEEVTNNLEKLLEEAAGKTAEYTRRFLNEDGIPEVGPSLNFGIPNVSREAFAYSDPELETKLRV